MKKIIFIILIAFLGGFSACKEKENTYNLTGNWINEQKDTLAFISNNIVNFKSHKSTIKLLPYSYEIAKDSIILWLMYSSNTSDIQKYYFKYSDKQIEIRNFQNTDIDFYKRLK